MPERYIKKQVTAIPLLGSVITRSQAVGPLLVYAFQVERRVINGLDHETASRRLAYLGTETHRLRGTQRRMCRGSSLGRQGNAESRTPGAIRAPGIELAALFNTPTKCAPINGSTKECLVYASSSARTFDLEEDDAIMRRRGE